MHRKPKEEGSALVLTLIVLVVLGLIVSSTYLALSSSYRSSQVKLASSKALYAAESGINDALWHLNLNGKSRENGVEVTPDWEVVNGTQQFTVAEQGYYETTVEKSGSKYILTSQGYSGSISRTVRLTIPKPTPAAYAVNYVIQFEPGNNGSYETISDPNIPALPEASLNQTINYEQGELIIEADWEQALTAVESIVVGRTSGSNNITITGDLVSKYDLIVGDGVTINGNLISEHGNIYLGKNVEITGSVIALEGDVNWVSEGSGHAYGNSNHILIEGIVYGNTVAFGNNCIVNGAVIGETVEFHTNGTVNYVPENIPQSFIQFTSTSTQDRVWELI